MKKYPGFLIVLIFLILGGLATWQLGCKSTVDGPINEPIDDFPGDTLGSSKGKYGLSIPNTMVAGVASDITLVIAIGADDSTMRVAALSEVPEAEHDNWKVLTEEIKVGSRMRARLVDPARTAFEIVAVTSSDQWVDMRQGEQTMWVWTVVPKQAGVWDLRLVVEILYGEERDPRSVEVAKRQISVTAASSSALGGDDGAGSGIKPGDPAAGSDEDSPYFLLIIFLAVLVIVGGSIYFSRRQKRKPEDGPEALPPGANLFEHARARIKEGELTKAMKLLERDLEANLKMKQTEENEDLYNQVLLHLSRLNKSKKEAALGMADEEDTKRLRAQITYAILGLIDEMEEVGQSED